MESATNNIITCSSTQTTTNNAFQCEQDAEEGFDSILDDYIKKDQGDDELKADPDFLAYFRTKARSVILTPEVLDALDRTKTTTRSAFSIIASVLKAMEIDLDSVRISCSTIFRARVQHRKVHFKQFK